MQQHVDTTLTIDRPKPKVNITDSMKKQYEELCSSPAQINAWQGRVQNHGVTYYRGRQSNLWNQKNESELMVESHYEDLLKNIESLMDSYMDGTCKLKEWNKKVKKMNKICKDNKLPFSVKVFKLSKHELSNQLMTSLPDELVEWEDNNIKDKIETMNWNNSFGGGYGY